MTTDKQTYENIVRTSLEAMKSMAIEDADYNKALGLDLIHYYQTKIVPDGVITEAEFTALCMENGIVLT